MNKVLKRIIGVVVVLVVAVALVIGGYAIYLQKTYYRLPDHMPLSVSVPASPASKTPAELGKKYKAVTYNMGFGAYTPDYSFFLDEGRMQDGKETKGTHGKATNKESVIGATTGALDAVKDLGADIVLLQEIDVDADRSYHVNQLDEATRNFDGFASTYGENFHSGYLALPLRDPHGKVKAGLATFSSLPIANAERRSLPIEETFPEKFFDLDRCITINRIPVANGKELVMVNVHMSAYDDGSAKEQQLKLINELMAREYAAGNYVILGGDWNHVLFNSDSIYPTEQQIPDYVVHLDDSMIAPGFHIVQPANLHDVATCRGADTPYTKGVNFTQTIDGFIVSPNVEATAYNVDTEFQFSDHNPVELEFSLKG